MNQDIGSTTVPDAADSAESDQDAADARQRELDAFDERNAESLDRDDDFRNTRQKLADTDEERAAELYKPPAEKAAEKKAAAQFSEGLKKELADNTQRETVASHERVTAAHSEALKQALPEFQQRAQRFQSALSQLGAITDINQRQRAEQILQAEATWLEQRRHQINESAFVAQQSRLMREQPGLADRETRRQLVSWAKSRGYTDHEISTASPEAISKAYRAMMQENIAKKRVADEKAAKETARKAEKKRVNAMPLHERVSEMKGTVSPTIALYGAPSERSAHRRAIQKALK